MLRPHLNNDAKTFQHREAIDWPLEFIDGVCRLAVIALCCVVIWLYMGFLEAKEPALTAGAAKAISDQAWARSGLDKDKASNGNVGHITFIIKHHHRNHYDRG